MKIKVLSNDEYHIHTLKVIVPDDSVVELGNPVDAEFEDSVHHKWRRWNNSVITEWQTCYDDEDCDYGQRLTLKCPSNIWIHCPEFNIKVPELKWFFPDVEVIDALYILDD